MMLLLLVSVIPALMLGALLTIPLLGDRIGRRLRVRNHQLREAQRQFSDAVEARDFEDAEAQLEVAFQLAARDGRDAA